MKIDGIKDFDKDLQEAIKMCIDYLNLEEDVVVTKSDEEDYIYYFNDEKYYIIDTNEAYDLVENYSNEYLEELIYDEVPRQWRDYIDKDKWFDDHDEFTLEATLESYYDIVDYIDTFNNYEFYNVA